MNTMNQLLAQSRNREVARAAGHPGRLAAHEARLADRDDRTTRAGDDPDRTRARAVRPAAWLAALVAAGS